MAGHVFQSLHSMKRIISGDEFEKGPKLINFAIKIIKLAKLMHT